MDLGDAIYYAKQHVAGEPFVVLLGDTLVSSTDVPCTRDNSWIFTANGGVL